MSEEKEEEKDSSSLKQGVGAAVGSTRTSSGRHDTKFASCQRNSDATTGSIDKQHGCYRKSRSSEDYYNNNRDDDEPSASSAGGSQEDDESRSAVPGVVAVQGPNAGGASTSLRSSDLSDTTTAPVQTTVQTFMGLAPTPEEADGTFTITTRRGQNPDLPIALPAEVVVSEATSSSNNPIYTAEPMALTEPSTNEQQQHKAPFSKYMVVLVVLGAFLVIAVAVGVAVGVTAAMDSSTPLPPSPAPVFMARPNSGPTTTTTGLTATDPPLSSLNCLCWYNQQQILWRDRVDHELLTTEQETFLKNVWQGRLNQYDPDPVNRKERTMVARQSSKTSNDNGKKETRSMGPSTRLPLSGSLRGMLTGTLEGRRRGPYCY